MANAQTGGFHIVHICCVMNLIMKHDFSKHEFSQQTMEVRFRHWIKSKKVIATSHSSDFFSHNCVIQTRNSDFFSQNCEFISRNSDFINRNSDFTTRNCEFISHNSEEKKSEFWVYISQFWLYNIYIYIFFIQWWKRASIANPTALVLCISTHLSSSQT